MPNFRFRFGIPESFLNSREFFESLVARPVVPGHPWWGRWCSAKLFEWQGHSGILEFESQLNSSFFTRSLAAGSTCRKFEWKWSKWNQNNTQTPQWQRLRSSNTPHLGNAEATWVWALCRNWQTWSVWRNSNGVNTFLERPGSTEVLWD